MSDGRKDEDSILLDPRRNQCTKKKLFEKMLMKEIPG
jgi:hypothetical protein